MVSVPTFDQLLWPTVRALKEMGGSASNEELLAKIIELQGYSGAIQAEPHKNGRRTRLEYNLAWARTYLKKAGVITNSARGIWSLTPKGESISSGEIEQIPVEVRRQILEAQKERQNQIAAADAETESEGAEEPWKDKLLRSLVGLSPAAFERLAQRILREAGFIKVEVTGRSGDGGIDGIGVLRLNLLSFQVLFQCKRYKGNVGASVIRDFRGAMVGRSDKGLLITTGVFTPDAKREATRDGAPAIDLIDGDLLCDLLKRLKVGVQTEMVEKVTIDSGWFREQDL